MKMKFSELIQEIEALGKDIYINLNDWCRTESGLYCMVEYESVRGATRMFPIKYLHLKGDDFHSRMVIDKDFKKTFCRVKDDLEKLGFIYDLNDEEEDPISPRELMQKARAVAEEAKKYDVVNHPSHYTQGKIECIDALESATINKCGIEAVCTANIIKYLWRYENKNGIEDVKKAQWYLQKLLMHLEKGEKGND